MPAGGRKAGSSNYRDTDLHFLIDLFEERMPIGLDDWKALANAFNEGKDPGRPERNYVSLRKKFRKLVDHTKPTGDPTCPDYVKRAKRAYRDLERRYMVGELGATTASDEEDDYNDDQVYWLHDDSDEDGNGNDNDDDDKDDNNAPGDNNDGDDNDNNHGNSNDGDNSNNDTPRKRARTGFRQNMHSVLMAMLFGMQQEIHRDKVQHEQMLRVKEEKLELQRRREAEEAELRKEKLELQRRREAQEAELRELQIKVNKAELKKLLSRVM